MQWTKRMRGLLGAFNVALAALAAGCGDQRMPNGPATTYRLSGIVTETSGQVPVEGAAVTHVPTGIKATTDRGGSYSIANIPGGMATIMATKDGYENAARVVDVQGETRLDLQLARHVEPVPPMALSGLVYEKTAAGQVPVPGVTVEDSGFHWGAVTDTEGRYRIDYSRFHLGLNHVAYLYIAKEGFFPVSHSITIRGETLLDIEMVRR